MRHRRQYGPASTDAGAGSGFVTVGPVGRWVGCGVLSCEVVLVLMRSAGAGRKMVCVCLRKPEDLQPRCVILVSHVRRNFV